MLRKIYSETELFQIIIETYINFFFQFIKCPKQNHTSNFKRDPTRNYIQNQIINNNWIVCPAIPSYEEEITA